MIVRFVLAALVCAAFSATARSQTMVFSDDFESGLGNWTVAHAPGCGVGMPCAGNVTWYVVDDSSDCGSLALPFPSGQKSARFGHAANCDFAGDNQAVPDAEIRMSQPVLLPPGGLTTLRFFSTSQAEDNGHDARTVELVYAGHPAPIVLASFNSSGWTQESVDLTPYAGQSAQVIFRFRCSDALANGGFGWFVDDVRIESTPATLFCFGDGSGTPCPCANSGAAGHGCASSIDPSGALLVATGSPVTVSDTLVLGATGVSSSVVLFFQGTAQTGGGMGSAFGDGLRCAGGSIVRLGTVQGVGGAAQFPGPNDPQLHTAGQITGAGAVRTYQVWYRNAAPFCTPSTFNLTNGLQLTWQ